MSMTRAEEGRPSERPSMIARSVCMATSVDKLGQELCDRSYLDICRFMIVYGNGKKEKEYSIQHYLSHRTASGRLFSLRCHSFIDLDQLFKE